MWRPPRAWRRSPRCTPSGTPEELLGELISVALEELEKSFPYVKGSTIVATDEEGVIRPMKTSIDPAFSRVVPAAFARFVVW